MMNNKQTHLNYQNIRSCSNCDYSHIRCGELICQWHESYVNPTGKCSWWMKNLRKENKND
nr:MAG TPA: High potential iron-sulfur protein-sulfur protein, ELECTRON TRANSPORT, Iron.0A [Caudoviricetes sp.]